MRSQVDQLEQDLSNLQPSTSSDEKKQARRTSMLRNKLQIAPDEIVEEVNLSDEYDDEDMPPREESSSSSGFVEDESLDTKLQKAESQLLP